MENTTKKSRAKDRVGTGFSCKIKKFWQGLNKDLLKAVMAFVFLTIFDVVGMYAIGAPSWLIVAGGILNLFLSGLVFLAVKKKWGIHIVFLILAIPLGLMYLLAIPIGRVADEPNHFMRAYSISQGTLVSIYDENLGTGDYFEANVSSLTSGDIKSYEEEWADITEMADTESEKVFMAFPNTAVYSFIAYLPQTLGMVVGRIFGASVMMMGYLGRLFNLIVWILIVFFCLNYIPVLKRSLFFVALLPMSLHQAASLSPDALTFVVVVGLVTFVIYHLVKIPEKKFNKRDIILMILLTTTVCFCKYIYLPFCLLLVLLPREKFGSRKRKIWSLVGLFVVEAVLLLIRTIMTAKFFSDPEGVDAMAQLKYVIKNPLRYLGVWIGTMYGSADFMVGSTFGRYLEWLSLDLGYQVTILMVVCAVVVTIKYRDYKIRMDVKYSLIVIMFLIFAFTYGVEYLKWTVVGADHIDGVQGRYFLPFLWLVPVILMKGVPRRNKKPERAKTEIVVSEESSLLNYHSVALYSLMFATFGAQVIFAYHLML